MKNHDKDNLLGYGVLAIILILLVLILYLFNKDFPIPSWSFTNKSPETIKNAWKDTSTIINGLLSPVLLFGSVVLLWLTWKTSKKELQETRQHLHFQSNRDSLMIILDDLVDTLCQKVKPSNSQIESIVRYNFEAYSQFSDETFKKLFLFEKRYLTTEKLKKYFQQSFEEEVLQTVISIIVVHHDYMNASKENLDNRLFGFLEVGIDMVGNNSNFNHIKGIRKAIIYCLRNEKNQIQFELLCNILFCKVSFEVVAFLHKTLTRELDINKESKDLLEQLKILNKILKTRDELDKCSYLDTKYISN